MLNRNHWRARVSRSDHDWVIRPRAPALRRDQFLTTRPEREADMTGDRIIQRETGQSQEIAPRFAALRCSKRHLLIARFIQANNRTASNGWHVAREGDEQRRAAPAHRAGKPKRETKTRRSRAVGK